MEPSKPVSTAACVARCGEAACVARCGVSDCLRMVRSRIWQARISDMSEGKADVIELPRCYFEAIVQGLSAAA